jgi:hypothetical protein
MKFEGIIFFRSYGAVFSVKGEVLPTKRRYTTHQTRSAPLLPDNSKLMMPLSKTTPVK